MRIYQATPIVNSIKETLINFSSSIDENLISILLKELESQLSNFSDNFPKNRKKRMIFRSDNKNQVDVTIKGTLFSSHSLFDCYELIVRPAFLQFSSETIEIPEGINILAINDKNKSKKYGKITKQSNKPKQKQKSKIFSSSKNLISK